MPEIKEKNIKAIKKYIDGIIEELDFLEFNKRGSAIIDGSSIHYIKTNLQEMVLILNQYTAKDFDGLL
jgi:hypothetical protein